MIQDIEGANPESPRHGHVIVLSAVAAAVALVMLFALLAPAPRRDTPPTRVTLDQVSQLTDNVTSTECAPGIGSSPPVHLVFDRTGRVIAAYSSGRAGRFLPLPPGYGASGWLTVPCDTPDVFAPRINRVR